MADNIEGKLLRFPEIGRQQQPLTRQNLSQVYAPLVVGLYSELGVADPFLAMMGRYMADTQVGVTDEIDESRQQVAQIASGSDSMQWVRRTSLGRKHIHELAQAIGATTKLLSVRNPVNEPVSAELVTISGRPISGRDSLRPRTISTVATNMAFLETTVDALSNCVYMQHRFDHYIPDFNASYYGSDDTVSRNFMDDYSQQSEPNIYEAAVRQDHRNLRSGVALLFLNDELLRSGLVESVTEARWVTQALSNAYPTPRRYKTPTKPLETEDIEKRCQNLYVRSNVLLDYAIFAEELGL